MNNSRLGLLGALVCLAQACGIDAPPDNEAAPSPTGLVFRTHTAERTLEDCIAGAPGCAYIRFDHPNVVDPPTELAGAAQSITDAVQAFLSRPFRPDEPAGTPRELFERFIEEAIRFTGPRPMFLERKVFVVHGTSGYVSLGFVERSFLGGEEPLETYVFTNFDLSTGGKLSLNDVVLDTQREELRLVVERVFRENHGLDANTDLAEAGFTFEGNRFALTENFALEEEALSFYYNPAEIAAETLGPTELRVSYDDLDGLLTPLVMDGR